MFTKKVKDKFWSKVKKTRTCWNWIIPPNRDGYGYIRIDKDKIMSVHRFSWKLHKGLIPQGIGYHGICVLHKCDNRICVNPKHLFLGTHNDNMKDMVKKNRHKGFKGENSKRAKLTEKQVKKIRQKYSTNNYSQIKLAEEYNVCQTHISRIINYKEWNSNDA